MPASKPVPTEKECKDCLSTFPIDNFYISTKSKNGLPNKHFGRCKKCHNIFTHRNPPKPKPKKPKPYELLDPEVKTDIKKMLADGTRKKTIADKHGIDYNKFFYWVTKIKCFKEE